jgi:hypothetical protein
MLLSGKASNTNVLAAATSLLLALRSLLPDRSPLTGVGDRF